MERLFTLGLSNAMAATVLAMGVAALGRLLSRRPAALTALAARPPEARDPAPVRGADRQLRDARPRRESLQAGWRSTNQWPTAGPEDPGTAAEQHSRSSWFSRPPTVLGRAPGRGAVLDAVAMDPSVPGMKTCTNFRRHV